MSAETFVDTNILIYAHDVSAGNTHQLARSLVSGFWKSGALVSVFRYCKNFT